jgi:hypothetical protein
VNQADTFLTNFETYKNTPPPKSTRRRSP